MATTYFPAPDEVRRVLDELIEEYRPDLTRHGEVKIGLTMAVGYKGKVAMKTKGQRILGKCKINGPLDKAQGKPDADVTLDGDYWAVSSQRRRKALMHHELSHIAEFDGDRDELTKRANLVVRNGDWNFDGFHECVELYGEDSAEAANLNMIAERHRQLDLPFGRKSEPEMAEAV